MNGAAPPAGDTGAVVVNYNAGAALADCVASLQSCGVGQIVVVDNGSVDGSLSALAAAGRAVRIERAETNLGYGRALNRGVALISAPFVLVVNPDVVLEADAVEVLASQLASQADVAVAGPLIRDRRGLPYPSARTFPSFSMGAGHALAGLFWPNNRWTKRYRGSVAPGVGADGAAREVDWVSGACALVRREAFDSVGGFDEGYFMYVEDLDLCWRLRRAGWRVLYVPAAAVRHLQGLSAAAHPYRMLFAHHRSALRFARKSLVGPKSALLVLVAAGLVVRLGLACARQLLSSGEGRRAPGLD